MSTRAEQLEAVLREQLGDRSVSVVVGVADQVTVQLSANDVPEVCRALRDRPQLGFDQLIDVCGVDYAEFPDTSPARFAVVYHLLSTTLNWRLRVRAFLDDEFPLVASVVDVWPVANWFEREAFDLFGIVFDGHPDLRRILTDYGFLGHPLRKDFPLNGEVEMRYDPEQGRVIYEPVSIENRISVPRVRRDDFRYEHPAG
ncbi:NADH-quinone oxidoreductase subunit C [Immundisolibacter sp.]|uniref:NADH-quinone oxidoreductase subunit C n=1 Tax=Immundisolibacter sp. TaxID=1934948 RepID=UPI002629D2F7|nr:NADH-quinone oxidoreductase subunit C [Immundisolibacter sp.]MDD3650153.1 NADH-quinone oxidoreductase subunit C [Immundisolibacter sp.]